MKTNALLCRTDGSIEVLRDVKVTGEFISKTIGCDCFNLVRIAPSTVRAFEDHYAVKLWHAQLDEETGAPIRLYVVCDDEGFAADKPFNPIASVLYASAGGVTPVVGDVLIAEVA